MTRSNIRRTVLSLAGLLAMTALAGLAIGPAETALAGGGACHNAPAGAERDAGGTDVSMKGNCFVPTVLRVDPGTTVTFKNLDPNGVFHEIAGVAMIFGGTDVLKPNDSITAAFETPGVYPYACRLHFGMVGAIVVGDGKFEGAATGVTNLRTSDADAAKASSVQPAPSAPQATTAGLKSDSDSKWLYGTGGAAAGGVIVAVATAGLLRRRRA